MATRFAVCDQRHVVVRSFADPGHWQNTDTRTVTRELNAMGKPTAVWEADDTTEPTHTSALVSTRGPDQQGGVLEETRTEVDGDWRS